jgi:hypothetical protein
MYELSQIYIPSMLLSHNNITNHGVSHATISQLLALIKLVWLWFRFYFLIFSVSPTIFRHLCNFSAFYTDRVCKFLGSPADFFNSPLAYIAPSSVTNILLSWSNTPAWTSEQSFSLFHTQICRFLWMFLVHFFSDCHSKKCAPETHEKQQITNRPGGDT